MQMFLKISLCCAETCHKVQGHVKIGHAVLTSLISGWEVEDAPVHSRFVVKPAGSPVCPPASRLHMCSKYRVNIHYEGTDVAQTLMDSV